MERDWSKARHVTVSNTIQFLVARDLCLKIHTLSPERIRLANLI